jgi:tetratricopeptide (TPR) repeat protein
VTDSLLERRGALLILAVTAACYAALLQAGFVWDDRQLVEGNRLVGSPEFLSQFMRVDLWSTATGVEEIESGYYRPLFLLSLALDRMLWGLSPAGHHLQSLVWHLAAATALWRLLRQLVPPVAALLGMALFALHPIQVEAVAWVSARNDPMAAALLLGALAVLLPASVSRRKCALGGGLCLAALLSKESAVLAPVFLLLLDFARWRKPGERERYLALGVALAAWILLRTWAGVGAAAVPDGEDLAQLVRSMPTLVGGGVSLLAWPSPLSTGRFLPYLDVPLESLVLGWSLVLVGAAFAWRRGGALAGAGLAMAALVLAPSLLAMASKYQVGERYLYLSMAGLALGLAAAVPTGRRALWGGALLALPSVLVIRDRVPDWQDGLHLLEAAVADTPNPYTFDGLGFELDRVSRPAEAAQWFQKALQGEPAYTRACLNALKAPLRAHDSAEALGALHLARERGCPQGGEFKATEAMILLRNGQLEAAQAALSEVDPKRVGPAWMPVAAALAKKAGDEDEYQRIRALATGDHGGFDAFVNELLEEAGY